MWEELDALFGHESETAQLEDYRKAVVDFNVLGKPSRKARELTCRYLVDLYALTPDSAIFRALRKLWAADPASRPMLALMMALTRDPLLRASQEFILSKHPGEQVFREDVAARFEKAEPGRFSPASLKSLGQNLNGSWTQAGLLKGHVKKIRAVPEATAAMVCFALFLGYLEGHSGQLLFTSSWMALLSTDQARLEILATSAANRGLMVFMQSGGVKEVRFPGWLTPEEEQLRLETENVQ